jgi:penicillin V acylase-like amidase (Ntn superfamily)
MMNMYFGKKGNPCLFTVVFVLTACGAGLYPSPVTTVTAPAASEACSSFCLDNNGYSIFGTNYDHSAVYEGLLFVNKRNLLKTGLGQSTTGEYAEWVSKYGSVTFNLVGYQFAWAGMNEAGLVISTMNLGYATQNPLPDERPPLESPFWVQYQLDTCSTVEEVLASDSLVRIANTADHYLVCDRTGTCAAIEFIGGDMVCHTGESMLVKALTNHTYRESVRAWQESSIFPVTNTSLRRFSIAANRVKSFNPDNTESAIDYAFDTLALVRGENMGRSNTFWSIVFDTENFFIYFRTKYNPQIRYIDATAIDFSCKTPAKMLNINEELSGDVTSKLKEYSLTANRVHMARFCEEWGIDISPSSLTSMCRHFDRFPCVNWNEYAEQDSKRVTTSPSGEHTSGDTTMNLVVGCLLVLAAAGGIGYIVHKSRKRR